MPETAYDLAVLGAGSAGFSAAITAAEQGARVALIGHGTIGGTCVNVGCVPSKTLIRAAEEVHNAQALSRFAGLQGRAEVEGWSQLVAQKDDLVSSLRSAKYIDVLPAYDGVSYLQGPAKLAPGGVVVDGNLLAAGKTIIATGASADMPDIAGIEDIEVLTSTTALELEVLPKSMLVVGGGYIGVELAQMFARLGVAVTLVCRTRLLPEAEPEISTALAGIFRGEGLEVCEGVAYRRFDRRKSGAALSFEQDGKEYTIEAHSVLAATGRRPNTAGLGLAAQGIETHAAGGIVVDDRLRTARPDVYAVGDVTGRDMFVYMAAYGGRIAAENALNGNNQVYDAAAMPAVTFCDPQAASVGLSEAAARAKGLDVVTSLLPLEHVPRALAARDTRGLIKLVALRGGALIGAHMLAAGAGDAIQTAALAIKHGMTPAELGQTIFPYLTMVEGLKLAAQTFDKDVAKLSCCAG